MGAAGAVGEEVGEGSPRRAFRVRSLGFGLNQWEATECQPEEAACPRTHSGRWLVGSSGVAPEFPAPFPSRALWVCLGGSCRGPRPQPVSDHFHHLSGKPRASALAPHCLPHAGQPLTYFLPLDWCLLGMSYQGAHGILEYVFADWLLSLTVMFSSGW